MSSGKLEGNYIKNFQSNLRFDESAIFTKHDLQKSNNSERLLTTINLKKDTKGSIKEINTMILENHFKMIKEIHITLKKGKDLTQKQKFAYCNSQRFFMKLYLRRISEKY